MAGWLWSLAAMLGPILLMGAIVWAYLRNRNAGAANLAQAERGAQELREESRATRPTMPRARSGVEQQPGR